jgi:hypothetical protein
MGQNPSKGINCPKCRKSTNVFLIGNLYATDVWARLRCGGCNLDFALPKAEFNKIVPKED